MLISLGNCLGSAELCDETSDETHRKHQAQLLCGRLDDTGRMKRVHFYAAIKQDIFC